MKPMSLHFGALVLLLCHVSIIKTEEAPSKATEDATPATNVSETTKDPRLTGDPRHDYIYDPNLPRELNGYDLSTYPFYTSVPTDITFKCDGRHDGYYASIPHHCQLFHLCVHSHRHDFLCANYTVFDQTQFICHFVNSVNCSVSELYYDRNNELYVTTTTEAPEYEDEYYEEPRTKRPKRRKNRRKQKRRRTTTPPPEDYYDYYEDEESQPAEYEDEAEEAPRPPPKRGRSRTRTTTDAPTEEPTTRVNVPKVRRPQLRVAKPLAPPPAEPEANEDAAGSEDTNTDAAAEVPVVAERPFRGAQPSDSGRPRRPFRGSPPTVADDVPSEPRPARPSRPTLDEVASPAAERPFRGARPAPSAEDAEPVRRPHRQRRPPPDETAPIHDVRGRPPTTVDDGVAPTRSEPLAGAADEAIARPPSPHRPSSPVGARGEEARSGQRPLRQPPRQVPLASEPLASAPTVADPTSVIAGILSGVGALPPSPLLPPPAAPAPESGPTAVDRDRRGRRPSPSVAGEGAGVVPATPEATAPEAGGSLPPSTNGGKRRVVQRRRKNRKSTTTTTTTTTTTPAAEYEYEYIE